MTPVLWWAYDEAGNPTSIIVTKSCTWSVTPPYPGHPGRVDHEPVPESLMARVMADEAWTANPHHCLPSPICETCGRQAGSPEESMGNAVMAGRVEAAGL